MSWPVMLHSDARYVHNGACYVHPPSQIDYAAVRESGEIRQSFERDAQTTVTSGMFPGQSQEVQQPTV